MCMYFWGSVYRAEGQDHHGGSSSRGGRFQQQEELENKFKGIFRDVICMVQNCEG